MKNIRESFENIIGSIYEKDNLKLVTSELGKIIIQDDKIVCKIDNKMLQNKLKNSRCKFILPGNEISNLSSYNIIDTNSNLAKSIYYIFENVDFSSEVEIVSEANVNVSFKNCIFHDSIKLIGCNEVVFDGARYIDKNPKYYRLKNCLYTDIKKLKFINSDFLTNVSNYNLGLSLNLNSDIIIIHNSKFANYKDSETTIDANCIIINHSEIISPRIFLQCENSNYQSSNMVANECITIESKNYYSRNTTISSPNLLYNNVEFINLSCENTDKIEDILLQKRTMKLLSENLTSLGLRYIDNSSDKFEKSKSLSKKKLY